MATFKEHGNGQYTVAWFDDMDFPQSKTFEGERARTFAHRLHKEMCDKYPHSQDEKLPIIHPKKVTPNQVIKPIPKRNMPAMNPKDSSKFTVEVHYDENGKKMKKPKVLSFSAKVYGKRDAEIMANMIKTMYDELLETEDMWEFWEEYSNLCKRIGKEM